MYLLCSFYLKQLRENWNLYQFSDCATMQHALSCFKVWHWVLKTCFKAIPSLQHPSQVKYIIIPLILLFAELVPLCDFLHRVLEVVCKELVPLSLVMNISLPQVLHQQRFCLFIGCCVGISWSLMEISWISHWVSKNARNGLWDQTSLWWWQLEMLCRESTQI